MLLRSHQELERRVHEKNIELLQLFTSSQLTPQVYSNPYLGRAMAQLSEPYILDKFLTIPVWEKNLPKSEQDQNVDECIALLKTKFQGLSMGQDPLHDSRDSGDQSSSFSSSTKGKQREDMFGMTAGDTRPRWQVEYDAAESDDWDGEEGDKGAAGDNGHCSTVIREATYSPGDEKKPKARRLPDILSKGLVTMDICRELFVM